MRCMPWPALLTIASTLLLPVVAGLAGDARSVAVIALTQDGLDASIAAVAVADGEIVAVAARRILIARSDRAGFSSRLHAAGAWLVLPAPVSGCGPSSLVR
ncbi:hypothetical protein FMGBMHLM_0992 [Methylobacterium aerolatum]|nr:hypothetical protein FMGBMHLM_0992 [Methylobacterium aerolatum]